MLEEVDTAFAQAGLPGYSVGSQLDQGGYGKTFVADLGERRVVVKVLDTRWHEAAIRTPREVAALKAVSHPNVVKIVDEGTLAIPGEEDRYRFITCEFVSGSNLAALREAGHRFSGAEVLRIGCQIALGLQAVHDQQLVHRDVKPKNIMFDTATGTAVLLDVGIAKHLASPPITVGAAPGTYGWKSPEQIQHDDVDRRSDIYSLALVLYWAAAGVHPFERERALYGNDIEAAMLAGGHECLTAAATGLTPAIAAVIDSCLDPKPYRRPRRASDLAASLCGA